MPYERYEGAATFYNSKAWKKCRASYIAKVNGLCERCLTHNKLTPGYILHHKITLNPSNITRPEITLDHNNLEYLCLECHNTIHGKAESITAEGLMFNKNGGLVRA